MSNNKDTKYANKTWKMLEHAIIQIYDHNDASLSLEELYRNAYCMVLHNHGEKLYSGLVATMAAQLQEMSKTIEAAEDESFLDVMFTKWSDHVRARNKIRDILMYMDRTFIPSTNKTPIYELAMNLWREHVVCSSNTQIGFRLMSTLNDLILREREGFVIDRKLMRNLIKMLTDLGFQVYEEVFEKQFLQKSAEFYHLESENLIEYSDCGDYLKKAEEYLNKEIERVSSYLDPKTEFKITKVVEMEMIAKHLLKLVHMENSGLINMLVWDKYEDLGRMYSLFARVENGIDTIREVMNDHIRETGKKLVTDPERAKDPVEFVQQILDGKDKYDEIIRLTFNNDETFKSALDSSYEFIINLNTQLPELLSLFLDDKIRKGFKGSEADMEVVLDKIMVVLQYMQQKDVFEQFYEQHLGKRLRSGEIVFDDAEKRVIAKLKTQCGSHFTSKLETMLENRAGKI